ncbi:MAG: cytochrome c3 family protein, partial [Halobacteriota archaeon]|nr:cytochrome c3 family protein [Halobacteriota archaeon]
MDNRKIVLLLVAVLAIGLFALPSTIAMFGGQHNWYGLGDDGNQVPCEKCHADIYDEMGNTGPHSNMSCWYCHRTSNLTGYTYASGDGTGSTPGQEAHAASTVECMECHAGFGISGISVCQNCHWGFGGTQVHPKEWFDNDAEFCVDCHPDYLTGSHHT